MVNIITGRSKEVKKINIHQTVDDKTVVIGKNTPRVGKKETQRMLEQTLDTEHPNSPTRKVYERVWKGVKDT